VNVALKHLSSFHERFFGHSPVNRAVVDVPNQSLSMRISPLQKEGLVEGLKNVLGIICVAAFGTSWEPIDGMEPFWVPHNCKYKPSALDIGPRFCCDLIFGQNRHSARAREMEKSGLIARHQMSPTVFSRRFSTGDHKSRKFLAFCSQFSCQQVRHPSKTVRFESQLFVQMMQHGCMIHVQDLSNYEQTQEALLQYGNDFYVDVVERRSSGVRLIMGVFPAVLYLV
jgi:hypothetical protein